MPALVLRAVAALSRAYLRLGCRSVRVAGLDAFLRLVDDPGRRAAGRGLLTCTCRHALTQTPIIYPCWMSR